MRLDVYLYEQKFFKSREKARQAILDGCVCVDEELVTKPSYEINEDKVFINIIKESNPFAGRGGLKLQGAIDYFGLDINGVTALDIGASTGGFTDCMLRNGTKRVYACDVGHDQLDPSLREDARIVNLENTDIRELAANPVSYGIDFKFNFITIDVSFISITKILPVIKYLAAPGANIVCLIKPQFELGCKKAGKKGIVKDDKIHKNICENIKIFADNHGYNVIGIIDSPIKGGNGNKEFLMLLNSQEKCTTMDGAED